MEEKKIKKMRNKKKKKRELRAPLEKKLSYPLIPF